uniref:TERF1-interacting nuclear factor 2 N-terminal domain-containing protein n=1 Tax=Oryzias melastigma TaxID=30732 RepID=A0A3B3DFC0_ORYME
MALAEVLKASLKEDWRPIPPSWHVIRQKDVKHYGKVEEFVTMVTQTVPELLSFKQTAQLILGLRARVSRFHKSGWMS